MARILVTDAARGSAVAVIRSLGRRGWEVLAADADPGGPGLYSRYVSERISYPSPVESPDEMVAALLQVAQKRRVDLIIPLTDEVLLPLSRARERFLGVCKLALPEADALNASTDKLRTAALADELGVPTVRSVPVTGVEEAIEQGRLLGWPVVCKPKSSRVYEPGGRVEAFAVSYAADADDLARTLRADLERGDVLLQEYYPGEAHGVELLAHLGRPLAAFQHRRIREVPFTGGASSFRESVPLDPTLLAHAARLLKALRWTGLAMVEFKVGARGPVLMEINGRIWGSLPLAVRSGMDFPAKLVELFLGDPAALGYDRKYRVGVRSRNVQSELLWIGSVLRSYRRYPFLPAPPRSAALRVAARLAYPGDGYDILSWRDPRPGWMELKRIPGELRRKIGSPHAAPQRNRNAVGVPSSESLSSKSLSSKSKDRREQEWRSTG